MTLWTFLASAFVTVVAAPAIVLAAVYVINLVRAPKVITQGLEAHIAELTPDGTVSAEFSRFLTEFRLLSQEVLSYDNGSDDAPRWNCRVDEAEARLRAFIDAQPFLMESDRLYVWDVPLGTPVAGMKNKYPENARQIQLQGRCDGIRMLIAITQTKARPSGS